MKRCIDMLFWCICIAILWYQKKWYLFFCTMELIINQNSAFKSAPGYFFCGNSYSQNVSRFLKAISDSHVLMQMAQWQHATWTQKIFKCCKPTHYFQEISNKPKIMQNFVNIMCSMPTKLPICRKKSKISTIDIRAKRINWLCGSRGVKDSIAMAKLC